MYALGARRVMLGVRLLASKLRLMFEGAEVVRQGIFLYDGAVACDVRIVKHNRRYGSGEHEDPPEVRGDVEGEVFYVQFGSTSERGKYVAGSGAFSSVEEAVGHAERSLSGVTWAEGE